MTEPSSTDPIQWLTTLTEEGKTFLQAHGCRVTEAESATGISCSRITFPVGSQITTFCRGTAGAISHLVLPDGLRLHSWWRPHDEIRSLSVTFSLEEPAEEPLTASEVLTRLGDLNHMQTLSFSKLPAPERVQAALRYQELLGWFRQRSIPLMQTNSFTRLPDHESPPPLETSTGYTRATRAEGEGEERISDEPKQAGGSGFGRGRRARMTDRCRRNVPDLQESERDLHPYQEAMRPLLTTRCFP